MSKKTVTAKIISKNTFINSSNRSLHSIFVSQTNLITFETEAQKRIVLEVSPVVFAYFIEGDSGELVYEAESKSATFVSFNRFKDI
ncbi:MAG: hypothetical protein IJF35_01965 [Clostridia bacterium]|nr:DUF2500 domain-containing protein [Oscillospiraceae bacterium]MBQ2746465.1 hypothetical protein [Clostridia bacterium]